MYSSKKDIIVGKGVPPKIVTKARQKLEQYAAGTIHAKRFIAHDGQAICVGNRYRLLRRDRRSDWMLLTHERYNRIKDTLK